MTEVIKYIIKPLTLIGALNWGLIGLFGFDLVAFIFGAGIISTIIYSVIGICAAIWILMIFANKK